MSPFWYLLFNPRMGYSVPGGVVWVGRMGGRGEKSVEGM